MMQNERTREPREFINYRDVEEIDDLVCKRFSQTIKSFMELMRFLRETNRPIGRKDIAELFAEISGGLESVKGTIEDTHQSLKASTEKELVTENNEQRVFIRTQVGPLLVNYFMFQQ